MGAPTPANAGVQDQAGRNFTPAFAGVDPATR